MRQGKSHPYEEEENSRNTGAFYVGDSCWECLVTFFSNTDQRLAFSIAIMYICDSSILVQRSIINKIDRIASFQFSLFFPLMSYRR
jgi:hypothetical protein